MLLLWKNQKMFLSWYLQICFPKIQHHAQGEAQKIREYDNRMLFQKFEKIMRTMFHLILPKLFLTGILLLKK